MVRKTDLRVLLRIEVVVVLGSGLGIFLLDWWAAKKAGFLQVSVTHKVLRE